MRGGRAGEEEEAAADTELKTKTPHVNVGNKRCFAKRIASETWKGVPGDSRISFINFLLLLQNCVEYQDQPEQGKKRSKGRDQNPHPDLIT